MNTLPFECDECDGTVILKNGPGRYYDSHRGRKQIPEDFPTATCDTCGQVYLRTSDAVALDKIVDSWEETQSSLVVTWDATHTADGIKGVNRALGTSLEADDVEDLILKAEESSSEKLGQPVIVRIRWPQKD